MMDKKITPFILAGGDSRRFGENKAIYRYHGKPLISYVADQLSNYFESLIIIAKDKSAFTELGYPVIEDVLPYQNPLVGIYTGLMYSDTNWNLFLSCDMPFITLECIDTLVRAIPENSSDLEIIVPRTPQGLEPTVALYLKPLSKKIMEVHNEINSIKDFIRRCNCKIIDFKSSKPFVNVNTKDQLPGPG